MFLWSGDILMLYALLGMLLPLFRDVSNRMLLVSAFGLLAVPIAVDFIVELSGIYPSASVVELQQTYCDKYGITDENFAYWLRDAKHYNFLFREHWFEFRNLSTAIATLKYWDCLSWGSISAVIASMPIWRAADPCCGRLPVMDSVSDCHCLFSTHGVL